MNISTKVIGENIYEVTDGKTVLIYSPLKNVVAKKWHLIPFIQCLLIKAVPSLYSIPQNTLTPTVLELDMSHKCNLNCHYCSVNSNDVSDDDRALKMTFDMARQAIDRVIAYSVEANDPFTVVFIGKGEPTLNWNVLVQCVDYIAHQKQKYSARGKTVVVTNGILSTQRARWLAKNIDHIALSWDGDCEAQNTQRPLCNGGGSYSIVERTADVMRSENAYFEIRATWTKKNVNKMVEITSMFLRYKPFGLNYQPLLLTGRATDLVALKTEADIFVRNFIQSKILAKKSNTLVMMPSVDITRLNRKFCQAYEGSGFHLSANGSLTACECVFGNDGSTAGKYLTYGELTQDGFILDEEKVTFLKGIIVDAIPTCHNCFVRWHCAGGCLNTHLQDSENPLGERVNLECYLTKNIVWETLKLELGEILKIVL